MLCAYALYMVRAERQRLRQLGAVSPRPPRCACWQGHSMVAAWSYWSARLPSSCSPGGEPMVVKLFTLSVFAFYERGSHRVHKC